jgi:shikimate kinase
MSPMVIPSIILIGPVRTGKTTLADRLARDLGLPRQSLDDLRWTYYGEAGFDFAYNQALEAAGRWNERRLYWSRHDPYAIRRVLEEFGESHVIDFGGSHSLHEDEGQLEEVKRMLAPHPYIVLVLPCKEPEESLRVLNERRGQAHMLYGFDLNELMLRHRSNYELAKYVIYNHGKTVAETSRELIEMLGLPPPDPELDFLRSSA